MSSSACFFMSRYEKHKGGKVTHNKVITWTTRLWFLCGFWLSSLFAFSQAEPGKTMSITVDDLPFAGELLPHEGSEVAWILQRTERLLQALQAEKVPAIGFVNESKLLVKGELDERTALLSAWLDAGMELGNHTLSHLSLSKVSPEEFEADILRGEMITRWLVSSRGKNLTYFRYPFNHRGSSAAIRDRVDLFLQRYGYSVAPFTLDHSDYLFNQAYLKAHRSGEPAQIQRIKAAYLDHLREKITFFEEVSQKVFQRKIPQILLIHANELNVETMGDMLSLIRSMGYAFESLGKVLEDNAYQTPDGFVGSFGPSWLHRFSISLGVPMVERNGKKFPAFLLEEPDPPSWILD